MLLDVFPTGPIAANCVLLADDGGGPLAVFDPGDEDALIVERIRRIGRQVAFILHTHAHFDHAGATGALLDALGGGIPVGLHPEDRPIYEALPQQARLFGFDAAPPPPPDVLLEHGQTIALGALTVEVRHTPGHSPGGVTFVVREPQRTIAIVGDLIFEGAVGRTDLWGGSFETLARSIKEQIYTLPPETILVPGHGPTTTVAQERAHNSFVRGA